MTTLVVEIDEKRWDFIIYMLTNTMTGMSYIGRTVVTLERRWTDHIACANRLHREDHKTTHLHNAILKYPRDIWEKKILFRGNETKININQIEASFIAEYKTRNPFGYNLTDGGDGLLGHVPTQETREKQSKAKKGKKFTQQHCDNMSAQSCPICRALI
jgi:group I intron endonuclease